MLLLILQEWCQDEKGRVFVRKIALFQQVEQIVSAGNQARVCEISRVQPL